MQLQGATYMDDTLKDAEKLLKLLGLSQMDIEDLLKPTDKEKLRKPKLVQTEMVEKEYILKRTEKCRTCVSETERVFYMKKYVDVKALVAVEITGEVPGNLPVLEDKTPILTCHKCIENLLLLEKEDLVELYLSALNGRGNS